MPEEKLKKIQTELEKILTFVGSGNSFIASYQGYTISLLYNENNSMVWYGFIDGKLHATIGTAMTEGTVKIVKGRILFYAESSTTSIGVRK